MIVLESHKVLELDTQLRLSDYLIGKFKAIPTRKGIKKAIQKGQVKLNGEKGKTGDWIKPGDFIELIDIQDRQPKAFPLDLDIVYEDEFLAVINKPAGIPVSGNQFKTIQNALIGSIQKSKVEDALSWPKPVHRLDASTSGLLLIAKSYNAMIELGKMFAERKIDKSYHTIVIGQPESEGKISTDIDNQIACTNFQVKRVVPSLRNKHLSLLQVRLETGRTHQIRIHLSSIGYPIFGDKLYGVEGEVYKGKGLFLASTSLSFKHPITDEELSIAISVPDKFNSLLNREERRWKSKLSNS